MQSSCSLATSQVLLLLLANTSAAATVVYITKRRPSTVQSSWSLATSQVLLLLLAHTSAAAAARVCLTNRRPMRSGLSLAGAAAAPCPH
jgi:hypothetical protein